MPITARQRLARRNHLGSSDAPAILGLSPWRSRGDVYYSKVLDAEDAEATEATEAMETGNRLEAPLLEFAAERLGMKLRRNQHRVSDGRDGGILAANFDALVCDRPEAVEAKYVGPNAAGEWGQEGTDEVPDHVNLQCQHQMYVGGLSRVWVAAVVAAYRLEWRLYLVPRSPAIIAAMVDQELAFWREHVSPRIPPDEQPPPLELIKALRREPGSCVDLGDEALQAWLRREVAAEQVKAAEAAKDAATAELLALLGTAEAGWLPDGRMLTYLSQRSAPRCDLKRLRAEAPNLYSLIVTEGSHRVLRIKAK